MKRFFLSVVLATTLALTSCQFDDSALWSKLDEYGESIRDHEQRISALEELCKQMNTNIEALQTLVDALEKRDYVTNVSEVRSNGEVVGYTISFAYSDTITIYHGEDGKDGANGKDGYTPQIGVMKDTDGIYYWTLDGEWLLDGKGNKIQANGVNGTDGTNGSNGTNGTNGVTPQLKIENDYWYVSYDNGATWEKLGKATGNDGLNGENGEDGDSIFKSVTQDDEYVYFNLSDGTMITLPKHDKENIQFEDLQVKAICCKNWDTNNDGELSYAEAAAVETIGTVFQGKTNIIAFTELKYFTGITEIPANAFNGCTALWKVKIPENVLTIGSSAFYGCKGIINIVLPSGVVSIGNQAFYGCKNLSQIVLSEKIEIVAQDAFSGCDSLPVIDNIRYADTCVVGVSEELDTYTIREGTRIIGVKAFYYNRSLTSITIPNSVVTIGEEAFDYCTALTNVTIGNNICRIERRAFSAVSNNGCNVYCKSETPPSIYYTLTVSGGQNYVESTFGPYCRIYVPRNSYDAYTQYSSYKAGCYKDNWCECSVMPYDFE